MTIAQLQIEKIETQTGYTILKENELLLPETYNYSLHIIDLVPIETIIVDIKLIIKNLLPELIHYNIKVSLLKELDTLLYKLKTLKDGHHSIRKRGLVNFLGTINKWITGTMDDEDRQLINKHLNFIDSNNENIISNINQQIQINNNFNKSINKLFETIIEDRKLIQEFMKENQKYNSLKLIIFDIKLKIQEIDRIINDLQDNIVFSKLNIIHPSLLAIQEIVDYKIDVNKIRNLKVGFSKTNTDKLIFLIKIPYSLKKVNKKLIIPLANENNCKIINSDITETIEYNNNYYEYNENKPLNYLNSLKHCIINENCKIIENCNFEINNINDGNIIIQLANKVNLTSSCDERKFILNGNHFIKFYNCSIKINDKIYHNKIKEINDNHIIQNLVYKPNNNVITFKELINDTENNINEIAILHFHKTISYSGIIIIVIIIIVVIVIISYIYFKQKKLNLNIFKRIQENPKFNEGRVIYHNESDKVNEEEVENTNPHKTILF